jgi:hypothetical protein
LELSPSLFEFIYNVVPILSVSRGELDEITACRESFEIDEIIDND